MAQTGHADFSRPAVIFARQILGIRAAVELTADNALYVSGREQRLILGHQAGQQLALADQRYGR